jgi:hypothetical protein
MTIITEVSFVVTPLLLGLIAVEQREWVAAAVCLSIAAAFFALVRWRWRQAWSKHRPR